MASVLQLQDLNLPTTLLTPKPEPHSEPFDHTPSPPIPIPTLTDSQTTPPPHLTPTDGPNVYSEYYRISQLFQNAFAEYVDLSVVDPDARAIVPLNNEDDAINLNPLNTVVVTRRKYKQRSGELVRHTDLSMEEQRNSRDSVRRTRMVYDALRIVSVVDEGKRRGDTPMRRSRGDLLAASILRDRDMWLNRDKRIVGAIPGILIGDMFFFRMELCVVGLHGQVQAGIDYLPGSQSSNGEPIATSVIVSGGYEDDEDVGDVIIYTGHGGQDKFSRQCMHQKLEGGNLALERSMQYGIEVRVIRGIKYDRGIQQKVYVYDGLYRVHECWFDVGKSGFGVYKYKLVRIEGQPEMGSSILKMAQSLRREPLNVRPRGYLSLDISNRKENMKVYLFNDIDDDHDPLCYEYLPKKLFPPFVYSSGSNETGCDCAGGCVDGCFCAMKNGGDFGYDHHGYLLRGKPLVFECGPFCKCPPTCQNRVSQKGLKHRLEVFRSKESGWGVRSLDLIHAGEFICEYAGIVLTREQAQIFSMNGDSLIYPSQFSRRWEEWGDFSQIFQDYERPSYPSLPPLDFAMDVSRMRNVACYMSHSSVPNVFVQFVLYDHNNLMFPHLMLFAMENIPPLRELSLDYGVPDECIGKLAICH